MRDKEFNIAKSPKYGGDQKILASMFYKFFVEKSKGGGVATLANKSAVNIGLDNSKKLAEKLHKPISRKF